MTLISAFLCSGSAVICADSQETVGDYRVSVDKISPKEIGEYTVVIGGSGNGDLIDGFTEAFYEFVETWEAGLDKREVKARIGHLLSDYYGREVALYPDEPREKVMHFIVCIKPKESAEFFLWELRGTAIVGVKDFILIGIPAAIYKHQVQQLYKPNISISQAVLLGINLFSVAKATSNYIGLDTQVIIVRDNGMWLQSHDEVRAIEERTRVINEALNRLVLACPDLSIDSNGLAILLTKFQERAMELREHYTKSVVLDKFNRILTDPTYKGDPFPKVATGTIIEVSQNQLNALVERAEDFQKSPAIKSVIIKRKKKKLDIA